MCSSFYNELVCEAELEMRKRSRRVGEFVNQFQNKFKKERINKLFSLRSNHLNFNCHQLEDKIVMNIKILETGWERSQLEDLLNEVALAWSNQSFELKFELVLQAGKDVVEIRRVASSISHVPDNDNRIIYLSKTLDYRSQKLILKHEFGHVLGFPDCYIEYYDEKEQKLIYYELPEKTTNIMCSMNENVKVPEDYFKELKERSCLFE